MRKTLLLSTTAVASLLVLSACGSYGGSNAVPSPAAGSIHVASTSLGKVLVDGDGHTLYRLTADTPAIPRAAASVWRTGRQSRRHRPPGCRT